MTTATKSGVGCWVLGVGDTDPAGLNTEYPTPNTHSAFALGPVDAVPVGEGRNFAVGRLSLAVFRQRDGSLYATESVCPHEGGPLADGLVGGCAVICPLHSLKFDLATGACASNSAYCIRTFPVWEAGGMLFVTVADESPALAGVR